MLSSLHTVDSPLNQISIQTNIKISSSINHTMPKSTIIILVSALCFLSLFGSAYCQDRFYVEGLIYCDTCRIQFITKLTEFLEGATVRVECKEENNEKVTFSKEAVTDASGSYKVEVDGDHEEDICEVKLVKSPRPDCSEIDAESHLEQSAKISITKNNGIVSDVRNANPLGFLRKERLPACAEVLKDLGVHDDGTPI